MRRCSLFCFIAYSDVNDGINEATEVSCMCILV